MGTDDRERPTIKDARRHRHKRPHVEPASISASPLWPIPDPRFVPGTTTQPNIDRSPRQPPVVIVLGTRQCPGNKPAHLISIPSSRTHRTIHSCPPERCNTPCFAVPFWVIAEIMLPGKARPAVPGHLRTHASILVTVKPMALDAVRAPPPQCHFLPSA